MAIPTAIPEEPLTNKFGNLDDEAAIATPTNKLPSYMEMSKLAVNDQKVAMQLAKERAESAANDFGQAAEEANLNWANKLELNNQTGTIKPTIDNIQLILENDPNLKGKFALNEFAGRGEGLGELPWSPFARRRIWTDTDSCGLHWYFEKFYKLVGNSKIDEAWYLHSEKHKFNDVEFMLFTVQRQRSVDFCAICHVVHLLQIPVQAVVIIICPRSS